MAGLNTTKETIQCFRGFTEHAYRLVFPYGIAFPDREPELLTILPNGTVENRKVLEPKQGKGLLAYPYIQTIDPTLATEHLETPFVREREDGSLALVQTWSTNYNDSFREQYDIHKENPDTSIFSLQAAQEFQETLKELFGPATDEPCAPRMLYCHRASENKFPVFVGRTEEILAFLKENPRTMAKMDIVRLFEDGYETRVFCNDGKEKGNKTFKMARGEIYALYRKMGHCQLACVTPEEQFMNDRELFEEIALDDKSEKLAVQEEQASIDDLNDGGMGGSCAYPLERGTAFIKCKAAGDETDACDGALTDGEPSEELFAAAPNLLGKLTCSLSKSKDKDTKTATISSTALTRSFASENLLEDNVNAFDPEMAGEPAIDEHELLQFARGEPSEDVLPATAQRMLLDGFNCSGLPTVVVQSKKTDAKMAADTSTEIAEATPMALGHAATGTNMPLFGEMSYYVQREHLHDVERHKRQMQEARSTSIFEIQDAMNGESKKSVGANDACGELPKSSWTLAFNKHDAEFLSDQNAQRAKRFKQEKEPEEKVLDNSVAAIMHEELKPIGRANTDSVEECENKAAAIADEDLRAIINGDFSTLGH